MSLLLHMMGNRTLVTLHPSPQSLPPHCLGCVLSAPTLLGSPSLLNGSCPKMPPTDLRPPCRPDQKTVLTSHSVYFCSEHLLGLPRPSDHHIQVQTLLPRQGLRSSRLCAPGLSPRAPASPTRRPPELSALCPRMSPQAPPPCQQALQCLPHRLKVFRGNNQLCS